MSRWSARGILRLSRNCWGWIRGRRRTGRACTCCQELPFAGTAGPRWCGRCLRWMGRGIVIISAPGIRRAGIAVPTGFRCRRWKMRCLSCWRGRSGVSWTWRGFWIMRGQCRLGTWMYGSWRNGGRSCREKRRDAGSCAWCFMRIWRTG